MGNNQLLSRGFIAHRWCAALQNMYIGRAHVFPAGFGGYNTRFALSMLADLLGPPPVSPTALVATVWFGANDAALQDKGHGWVHVPIDEYTRNLAEIVQAVKRHATHVVVLTPPRIDGEGRLAFQVAKYGARATGELERIDSENRRYAAAAVRVAETAGVLHVDVYSAMAADPRWREMLVDGLHFTPFGQRFVFDRLREVLATVPDLAVDALPRQFRHCTELKRE